LNAQGNLQNPVSQFAGFPGQIAKTLQIRLLQNLENIPEINAE